jgi:hypothetical protein
MLAGVIAADGLPDLNDGLGTWVVVGTSTGAVLGLTAMSLAYFLQNDSSSVAVVPSRRGALVVMMGRF